MGTLTVTPKEGDRIHLLINGLLEKLVEMECKGFNVEACLTVLMKRITKMTTLERIPQTGTRRALLLYFDGTNDDTCKRRLSETKVEYSAQSDIMRWAQKVNVFKKKSLITKASWL